MGLVKAAGRSGRITYVPLNTEMMRYETEPDQFTAMMNNVLARSGLMLRAAARAFPRTRGGYTAQKHPRITEAEPSG